MLYLLLSLLLIVLIYLPQAWVRFVMWSNARTIKTMPGTGGELAQHLIERYELTGISVEQTDRGDHFDPNDRAVRLSPGNFSGKSITAVAVAAHEVGHALQFHRNERIFQLRKKYIPKAVFLQKIGEVILLSAPLLSFVIKSPAVFILLIGASLFFQLLGALTFLIVLPEEWDASFNKALPILAEGYLPPEHLPKAKRVLRAAALTYFAGALASIINLGRWALLLRR